MGTYTKTFRIDPETGNCFEACDYPGRGDVICSIYGSQMPHTVIGRRARDEGGWQGRRFTKTAWAALPDGSGWEAVPFLIK